MSVRDLLQNGKHIGRASHNTAAFTDHLTRVLILVCCAVVAGLDIVL